jgi:hypothetical protein
MQCLTALTCALRSPHSGGENFFGSDTLVVEVSDEGWTGSGGPKTATATVPLFVAALNTAPQVIAPPSLPLRVDENAAVQLGVGVFDQDVEATPGGQVEVEVWTGHGGRLEVQAVRSFLSHVNQVQSITVKTQLPTPIPQGYVPQLSGSFRLKLDIGALIGDGTTSFVVTAAIDANAIAKKDEEIRSLGLGKDTGESMESKLRGLGITLLDFTGTLPGGFMDVEVIRTRLDDNIYGTGMLGDLPVGAYWGYRWDVTFHNTPTRLPLLLVDSSAVSASWTPFPTDPSTIRTTAPLPALTVQVTTAWMVPTNPLRGSFTLSLGGWVTSPIAYDASAARMKEALEALPNVGVVAVHRTPQPDVDDGYTWSVTVLDPPGNIPNFVSNVSSLTGVGARVTVSEVVAGLGQPELHTLETRAIHVNPVFTVQAVGKPGATLHGQFKLSLDFSAFVDGGGDAQSEGGSKGGLGVSAFIDVSAVAMQREEQYDAANGIGAGESMQSKLRGMIAAAAAATPTGPLHTIISAMDCTVTRGADAATADHSAGVLWTITFLKSPAPLPTMVVAALNLDTAAYAGSITVTRITADNHLSGTFSLAVRGKETGQLPFDATAAAVRTALLSLPTVRDEYALVGDVAVARSSRGTEGQYTWIVAFTQENPTSFASLVALGQSLQPQSVGASIVASLLRQGGQHPVLTLTTMESVGVVSQSGHSLAVKWITGTPSDGSNVDGDSAGKVVSGRLSGWLSGDSQLEDAFGTSMATPSITMRGPLFAVNNALRQMQYRGALNWNGRVAIRVSIDDLGNTGAFGVSPLPPAHACRCPPNWCLLLVVRLWQVLAVRC